MAHPEAELKLQESKVGSSSSRVWYQQKHASYKPSVLAKVHGIQVFKDNQGEMVRFSSPRSDNLYACIMKNKCHQEADTKP
jgi:hypothetical protein